MIAAPRVSVITPFLNAGPFIAECIDSVLAQTYDRWELLLVDDGSEDGSMAVALRYAARHPGKIRYLSHQHRENKGASAARNLGARHAHGEYLAYLDADDMYLPDKLKEQVSLLDACADVAMVYAATEYWYSWSGSADDARRDWTWRKFGAPAGRVINPPRMLTTFLNDGGTVPCMGSVLVRRAAVDAVGGWEESFRTICTDQVFHAKICIRFPVLIADGCWDRYRQHPDSACRRVERAGESDAAFLRYLQWLNDYVRRNGVTDGALLTALRGALRRYRHPWLYRAERRASGLEERLREAAASAIRRALPRPLRRRLGARWN